MYQLDVLWFSHTTTTWGNKSRFNIIITPVKNGRKKVVFLTFDDRGAVLLWGTQGPVVDRRNVLHVLGQVSNIGHVVVPPRVWRRRPVGVSWLLLDAPGHPARTVVYYMIWWPGRGHVPCSPNPHVCSGSSTPCWPTTQPGTGLSRQARFEDGGLSGAGCLGGLGSPPQRLWSVDVKKRERERISYKKFM